jgi:hypothetical protein
MKHILDLDRAGNARKVDDALVNAEEIRIRTLDYKSDDPHILALGSISGAMLLCSEDNELISDYLDARILTKQPRSAYNQNKHVFARREHAQLLNRCCTK